MERDSGPAIPAPCRLGPGRPKLLGTGSEDELAAIADGCYRERATDPQIQPALALGHLAGCTAGAPVVLPSCPLSDHCRHDLTLLSQPRRPKARCSQGRRWWAWRHSNPRLPPYKPLWGVRERPLGQRDRWDSKGSVLGDPHLSGDVGHPHRHPSAALGSTAMWFAPLSPRGASQRLGTSRTDG